MKTRLDEKLLTADFTFGFELEAYVSEHHMRVDKQLLQRLLDVAKRNPEAFEIPYNEIAQIRSYNQLDYGYVLDAYEDVTEDDTLRRDLYSNKEIFKAANELLQVKKYFPNANWVKVESKGITSDGSLNDCGFEWRSPVMTLTPESIAHTIAFLKHCKNNGIYVDESCGFHTHISFTGITEDDAKWIVMKLALDEEEIEKILELQLYTDKENKHEPISFRSQWSKTTYLKDLRDYLKKLSTETDSDKITNLIEKINGLLSDDKYRALRIHPQGTLEWRSPREFLDYDDKYIKSFFLSLYDFVSWMRKVLDEKEIANYSRDNLMKMLNSSETAEHPFQNKNSFKKILDKIDDNKYTLLKIGSMPLAVAERLFHYVFNTRGYEKKYVQLINNLIMEDETIPDNVLACAICCESELNTKRLLKILQQPIPIKEVEMVQKMIYGERGIDSITSHLDVLSKDDIKHVIKTTTLSYKECINEIKVGWDDINEKRQQYIIKLLSDKYNIREEVVEDDF